MVFYSKKMKNKTKKKLAYLIFRNFLFLSSHYSRQFIQLAQECHNRAINVEGKKFTYYHQGRYLRSGSLPSPSKSFWRRVDSIGDDKEFLHFTSLTRQSFNLLVDLTQNIIENHSYDNRFGKPRQWDLKKRMFKPRDVIAMALRYLLSKGEIKDLIPHFGATASTFCSNVDLGLKAIVKALIIDERSRVYWDRSEAHCKEAADLTSKFLDIPNVIGMIDGIKVSTQSPSNPVLQNRDYNGWTKEVTRNLIFLWDPNGMIVDAALNLPGSFHDSRSAMCLGGSLEQLLKSAFKFLICCIS